MKTKMINDNNQYKIQETLYTLNGETIFVDYPKIKGIQEKIPFTTDNILKVYNKFKELKKISC